MFNSREQRHDFSGSLTGDDAELGGVSAYRVDQSGALTDQGLTNLQDHALGLLRDRFRRHEMHPRTPGGLTDCFGVVAIVFAAFDKGFDVLRRDETHRVAERGQFASPIMGGATGFQGDDGGRQLPEEGNHLRTAEIDP